VPGVALTTNPERRRQVEGDLCPDAQHLEESTHDEEIERARFAGLDPADD
jgi:hypothetical protein